MKIVADLHVHSKFSRATSRDMDAGTIALWAGHKGIDLVGTGDFTHPEYLKELKKILRPSADGLFTPRGAKGGVHFMLTTEVSNIYSYKGRTRRIHNVLLAPSFEAVDRINRALSRFGRLDYDGRPMFGFNAKDLVKLVMDASPLCMVIPAHAWTPWYSVFGSNSGFDSIEECFEEQAVHIHAIETGLSSDPPMNWRLDALDRITLVSNSDAHSPEKLGREANVFECDMRYEDIVSAIKTKDRGRFLSTIEFFPEEGKYHFDGHRNCKVRLSPQQTGQHDGTCPVCGGPLTIGVLNRVERLATRREGAVPENVIPFKHLIPLKEIMADVLSTGAGTVKVDRLYTEAVIERGVPELDILVDMPEKELRRLLPEGIVQGVMKVRDGMVDIEPGYDGEYGRISIRRDARQSPQQTLF
ncbi:MAG: endonuclease Q family protein [Deltaproteobacteria bacterium]|nr:endonuclease Q family protein [Deltaproteobacteria bacterium]MCL5276797.1 endonuclease Q family protein [Deltaproteobacteria bacterium]